MLWPRMDVDYTVELPAVHRKTKIPNSRGSRSRSDLNCHCVRYHTFCYCCLAVSFLSRTNVLLT